MLLPESNLPPDAQKWRRKIEAEIAELKKAAGITSTNLNSTRARFTGVASQASAVEDAVVAITQEVGEVANEAHRNDRSNWEPKPPENPRHNQRWFDTTDGNLLRVWIDHGEYPRINYALNPNFSEGTENWTLSGGDLVWQVGFDPHADLVATADGATFVLEEVQGRTVSLELEGTDPDEDGEGGSETSYVGVPWSAAAHLTAYSDNDYVTAVLEVVDPSDNVLASSGPVVLPVEIMTIVQASSVLEEYEIVGAKLRLTITGVDEADFVSLDKVMLEAITEPEEDYFDGDMPGVEWETLPQGRVSAWSGEPDWYVLQDRKAIQEAIDGAKDTLARAFTTAVNAPTPADGADRPDGAYWTQINAEGEQVARWRWVEADDEWVSTPLSVEFIPEAYVDFLAANVAFINALEAEIVRADMFIGKEFTGGTFTGTTFRTATSGKRAVLDGANGLRLWNSDGGISLETIEEGLRILGSLWLQVEGVQSLVGAFAHDFSDWDGPQILPGLKFTGANGQEAWVAGVRAQSTGLLHVRIRGPRQEGGGGPVPAMMTVGTTSTVITGSGGSNAPFVQAAPTYTVARGPGDAATAPRMQVTESAAHFRGPGPVNTAAGVFIDGQTLKIRGEEQVIGQRIGVNDQNVTGGATARYTGFSSNDTATGGMQLVGNYGLRVPEDGWYNASASIRFGSMAADGNRQCRIVVNGSGRAVNTMDLASASGRIVPVSSLLELSAGDIVEMVYYSGDSGSTSIWAAYPLAISLSLSRA